MIGWLHGFLGAPAQWGRVRSEGDAWWMPGHGPEPRVLPGAGFDEVVDALAPWTTGRRVLVGYSLGARLALSLALRHPGGLRAVVLVGGTPGIEDESERAARAAADDALAESIGRGGMEAFVERWEALPLFATQRELAPEVLAEQRSWRTGHRPEAIAWALSTLSTGRMPPLWERLAAAPFTVHAVTGERDEKFTRIAEEMVRRGEGRVVHHRVAGVGHNVVLEDPAAVARVVGVAGWAGGPIRSPRRDEHEYLLRKLVSADQAWERSEVLKAIKGCFSNGPRRVYHFDFNLFDVTLDVDSGAAVIEGIFVSPAGALQMSVMELASILLGRRVGRLEEVMATLAECDRAAVIYAVEPWTPGSPAFIARASIDGSEPVEARAIGASRIMGVAEAMDRAAPQGGSWG